MPDILTEVAESFVHQLLSAVYAFAQGILSAFSSAFLLVTSTFATDLDAVFGSWGSAIGSLGILAPTVMVAGFGITVAVGFIVLDIGDSAKDMLGGD